MKIISTTSVELSKKQEFVPHFSVEMEDAGLRLQLVSPILASFLSKQSTTTTHRGGGIWTGRVFYVPTRSEITRGLWLGAGHGYFNEDGNRINMIWLFDSEFLKTGSLNILLPEPMTPNNLEDFFHEASTALRDFYLTKVRKVKLSLSLAVEDVEPEEEEEEYPVEETHPDIEDDALQPEDEDA